jgi:hypothetical protein
MGKRPQLSHRLLQSPCAFLNVPRHGLKLPLLRPRKTQWLGGKSDGL